ncbi:MAG TPA: hypothetical protein V6C97_30980 [Oculatellaceae cyanobacterium]
MAEADEFETVSEEADQTLPVDEEREAKRAKFREFVKSAIKKFFALISFGPGVLGLLWLIGKILRR